MEPWWVAIAVAVIGGPVMWLLSRLDKRNSTQHAASLAILEQTKEMISGVDSKVDTLADKVDRLDDRIYNHIESHAANEYRAS